MKKYSLCKKFELAAIGVSMGCVGLLLSGSLEDGWQTNTVLFTMAASFLTRYFLRAQMRAIRHEEIQNTFVRMEKPEPPDRFEIITIDKLREKNPVWNRFGL